MRRALLVALVVFPSWGPPVAPLSFGVPIPAPRFAPRLDCPTPCPAISSQWYDHARGAQQVFTVEAGPPQLRVSLLAEGAIHVDADGRGASLGPLRYEGLAAWDREGTPLPAWIESSAGGLTLVADARAALFPVTIDPIAYEPEWSSEGNSGGALLGSGLAAGDFDGDGFSDLAVGSPGASVTLAAEGTVRLWLGSDAGMPASASQSLPGGLADLGFGATLATCDIDGDGRSDLISGEPEYSVGGADRGRVRVFFGSATGLSTTAAQEMIGSVAGERFGSALAVGFFDAGRDCDLAAGAEAPVSFGAVTLHLGDGVGFATIPSWTLLGDQADAGLGTRVRSANDVDGDGYFDLLVADPDHDAGGSPGSDRGRVRLFLGGPAGLQNTAAFARWGESDGSRSGAGLAGVGDADGDVLADVVVGEPGWIDGEGLAVGRILLFVGDATGLAIDPAVVLSGEAEGGRFGEALTGLGDSDGDGFADLMWGSPGVDGAVASGEYDVGVIGGRQGGPGSACFAYDNPEFYGGIEDEVGLILHAPGDLDGDGLSDGLYVNIHHDGGQVDEGFIESHPGRSFGPSYDKFATRGLQAGAALGSALSGAGDVNGDGLDDVIVGTPLWNAGPQDVGRVAVHHGSGLDPNGLEPLAAWVRTGTQGGEQLGFAVAGGGDVDGDGYGDVVIGAPGWDLAWGSDQGEIRVFLGGPAGLAATPVFAVAGIYDGDGFGTAVALGDTSGDGLADVIVGAPLSDDTDTEAAPDGGVVAVYPGTPSGPQAIDYSFLKGTTPGEHFGASVTVIPRADGDEFGELLVGAPGYSVGGVGRGRAQLFGGTPGATSDTIRWEVVGVAPGDGLGSAVAHAGDVDGDGFSDLLVGAPGSAVGGVEAGWVGLWYGSSVGPSTVAAWEENGAAGDRLGSAVSSAGDLDQDGRSEILLGAPWADHEVEPGVFRIDAGTSSLWELDDFGQIVFGYGISAYQDGAHGGSSLAAAGDVDGDGYGDFLVGTPGLTIDFVGEGVATLQMGNGYSGHTAAFRLAAHARRSGENTPIAAGGQIPGSAFDVHGTLRSAWGRVPLRLEVEVKSLGTPFDGEGLAVSAWTDPAFAGASATVPIAGLPPQTAWHVRARVAAHPGAGLPQLRGPWQSLLSTLEPELPHLFTPPYDADGDGSRDEVDCDDTRPGVHPLAAEVGGNGLDDDCDGLDARPCFQDDADEDGAGASFFGFCEAVDCDDCFLWDGTFEILDCDDADAAIGGGPPESCNGLDDDCDGVLSELETTDGDGDQSPFCADCDDASPLQNPLFPFELCDGLDNDCDGSPAPFEADGDGDLVRLCQGDCDDTDPASYPSAPEGSGGPDHNCDGVFGDDIDEDGFDDQDGDCDDSDASVHPQADEICDGLDSDCDGAFGIGELDDPDGDGSLACADCWEGEPTVHPGAAEICDGRDNDCDGLFGTGEADADGDGIAPCAGDCDDGDAGIHPGQPEDCTNSVDDDCIGGAVDADVDRDGVGSCGGDCDDALAEVHLGAIELCNGRDDNCDTRVDEGSDQDGDGQAGCAGDCDDLDGTVFLDAPAVCDDEQDNDCRPQTLETFDGDGDGYLACPTDASSADCWEGNSAVFPGAPERCNQVDDDCDGQADEGFDDDGDGWRVCAGDCDDTVAAIEPLALDLCGDGLDADCDRIDPVCGSGTLTIVVPRGCGCQSSSSGGAAGWVAAFGWILIRGRRLREVSPPDSRR